MEKFYIEGGIPLKGEMTPSGNKNSALPILAATLMTDQPVILHNVPNIRDVSDMRKLVASLGVKDRKSRRKFMAHHCTDRQAGRSRSGPVQANPGIDLAGRADAIPHGHFSPSSTGRRCNWPAQVGYTHTGFQSPGCRREICAIFNRI